MQTEDEDKKTAKSRKNIPGKNRISELEKVNQLLSFLRHSETRSNQPENAFKVDFEKFYLFLEDLSEANIGVDIVGLDFKIYYQNRLLADRYGPTTGKLCYELYRELDKPCENCPMLRTVTDKTIHNLELQDAFGRYYELTSAPLPNPDGTVDKVIEVVKDITDRKQAEEALRESENKFSVAFRSGPDMFIISDIESGKYIEVNNSFTDTTGYSRDELIGHTVDEFNLWVNPSDQERFVQSLQKYGKSKNEEYVFRMKSGEIRTWLCSAEIVNIGRKPCMLAVATDITERKSAEKLLKVVIDNSPLSVYIMQDNRIIYANPQLLRCTGYREEELIERELSSLVVAEDRGILNSCIAITEAENKPCPCEYRIITKAGLVKRVLQTASTIRYQDKKVVLGNLIDVTEHKYLQEKVSNYEERNRLKDDLLAVASHEIRSPLATIKGYVTMLIDYFDRLSFNEKKGYLKSINKSVSRLTKLLENLMDTSQLETGLLRLNKTQASISRLIKDASKEASVRVNSHHISFELPGKLPRVWIDAKRIRQVIDNLIDNAIKYSHAKTTICIKAQKLRDSIIISVTDSGIGIPSDKIHSVFDRMYRIKQETESNAKGIGLGLYISQQLVKAHDGEIWAESEIGKGSTFFFTLPVPHKK